MCLSTEGKRHIRKQWGRLTSSKWTILFALMFFVQFLLVVFFQTRILIRNNSVYGNNDFKELYKCDKSSKGENQNSVDYLFIFSAIQSIIFMILQLYLVYFGLSAIFQEHIIQIITLVILNFGGAAYALFQLLDIKIRSDRAKNSTNVENCGDGDIGVGFKIDWLRVDLPQVITLTVTSVISAIIASKLYRQFGWSVYKRIGSDLKIQKIYRNNLVFLMLLKLNMFFWIIYIIPTIIIIIITSSNNVIDVSDGVADKVLIIYHSVATALALILQITAYRSVRRESRRGMITFTVLWLFIVIDYGILIYATVRLLLIGSYSLIIFTSVFVLIALATFVYAIIVTANFDQGLLQIIEEYKRRTRPKPDIPTLNIPPVAPSSSSVHSPASSSSQQYPPKSASSASDNTSNYSYEKRKDEFPVDDRWTIDD